jgi:hypothetical protein
MLHGAIDFRRPEALFTERGLSAFGVTVTLEYKEERNIG